MTHCVLGSGAEQAGFPTGLAMGAERQQFGIDFADKGIDFLVGIAIAHGGVELCLWVRHVQFLAGRVELFDGMLALLVLHRFAVLSLHRFRSERRRVGKGGVVTIVYWWFA